MLACSAPDPPRLVIVYATCSLGTTFLSPYHPELPLTPALQRFAEQAIVFERHQTESGQSGTAFASIFSGRQADEHGVYFHPTRLPEELLMLTEVLRTAATRCTASWRTRWPAPSSATRRELEPMAFR